MKSRFLATVGSAFVAACGMGSLPLAAQANSPLKFRPPSRSGPKITIGGASRSGCIQDEKAVRELRALLPDNGPSLTTSRRPSIMVYLPQNQGKRLDFVLTPIVSDNASSNAPAQRGKSLYRKSFPVSAQAGVVRLSLDDASVPELELGQQYIWSVSLMCEEQDQFAPDQKVLVPGPRVEGAIERIELNGQIQSALSKADAQQVPRIYAEAGVWYDALLSLDRMRQQAPQNQALMSDWESFLKTAGLADIAQSPVAECCKMQP